MSCGAETTRDYAHIAASYILTALITVHGVREHEQAEWDENEKKAEGCARAVPTRVSSQSQHFHLESSVHAKKTVRHTRHTKKHGLSAPRVPGTTQAGGGKARRGLTVGLMLVRSFRSPAEYTVESRTHAAALWRSQRRGTCGCAGGELNTSVGTVFLQRCSRSMLPGRATPRSFWPCTYGWGRANCSADGTRPFAPVCMPYTALDLDGWGRWRSLHPPRPQPSPSV